MNALLVFFEDINECEGDVSPCNVNAQCYNNQGSYYCECNVGYNGNGKVCNGESRTNVVNVGGEGRKHTNTYDLSTPKRYKQRFNVLTDGRKGTSLVEMSNFVVHLDKFLY